MTLDKLVMWQKGVWTHWFIIIKKDVNKGILSSASYLSFLASSMQRVQQTISRVQNLNYLKNPFMNEDGFEALT
jgi:hypothetical protein